MIVKVYMILPGENANPKPEMTTNSLELFFDLYDSNGNSMNQWNKWGKNRKESNSRQTIDLSDFLQTFLLKRQNNFECENDYFILMNTPAARCKKQTLWNKLGTGAVRIVPGGDLFHSLSLFVKNIIYLSTFLIKYFNGKSKKNRLAEGCNSLEILFVKQQTRKCLYDFSLMI